MVIVQIESQTGVDNAAAIAAEETVDGLLVGPVDLGQALGAAADSEELAQAMKEVSVAARCAGKPAGIAIGAQPQQAADLAAAEFDFTMTSNDATLLGASAAALVDGYRRALAGTTSSRIA
jgi:2-keto-3-deoxy-L-rhamnonate aldolase RhmA